MATTPINNSSESVCLKKVYQICCSTYVRFEWKRSKILVTVYLTKSRLITSFCFCCKAWLYIFSKNAFLIGFSSAIYASKKSLIFCIPIPTLVVIISCWIILILLYSFSPRDSSTLWIMFN